MSIGENVTLELGRVVLATGKGENFDTRFMHTRKKEYVLFAEVTSECPRHPSGHPSLGTVCFAEIALECEAFLGKTNDLDLPLFLFQCVSHELFLLLQQRRK